MVFGKFPLMFSLRFFVLILVCAIIVNCITVLCFYILMQQFLTMYDRCRFAVYVSRNFLPVLFRIRRHIIIQVFCIVFIFFFVLGMALFCFHLQTPQLIGLCFSYLLMWYQSLQYQFHVLSVKTFLSLAHHEQFFFIVEHSNHVLLSSSLIKVTLTGHFLLVIQRWGSLLLKEPLEKHWKKHVQMQR